MPTDLSGFVPDAAPAPKLPPGFIPDAKTSAASTDQGTLTASIPKETFDASGRQVGPSQNFISRKLREAENLTEEGKKAHPVEAFVGKVANAFKMPTNPVNIVGQMAPLLFAGEMPAPEDAAIAPHAERFAAPNEGKVATGPAPAQAYSRYGMKPENAVPNAAGTRDVGVRVTPPSTGGTMRPTVGETAPLRPEQKLLPAGPAQPTGRTAREVFARSPITSRSTPTGPSVPLPPELHADLERQAGRSLTDAEANALDRANLERGMIDASGRPDEASAIREAKRAELEQPGRPEIGQSAPVTGPTISTPAEANAAPGPKPTARQQVGKIVDMATGREPLNPKVSLREQIGRTVTPPNAKTELEAKYPDKAVRQMVHVQGERMVQAIGDDKQLMRDVHDLTKVDLSRAAENGGLDLGQKAITSSKFAGEGGITRQQVFEQLLDKGYSPREIVDLAKKEPAQNDRRPRQHQPHLPKFRGHDHRLLIVGGVAWLRDPRDQQNRRRTARPRREVGDAALPEGTSPQAPGRPR